MSNQKLTDKLDEIDKLVAWFGGDDMDIDEALAKFDQLTALADEAKKDLGELENKISVLKQKFSE